MLGFSSQAAYQHCLTEIKPLSIELKGKNSTCKDKLPKQRFLTASLQHLVSLHYRLPRWLRGKASACQCRTHRFNPCVGKILWRRKWQSTPVFLSGGFPGQRSLAGCKSMGSQRVEQDLAAKQQQSSHSGGCHIARNLITRAAALNENMGHQCRDGSTSVLIAETSSEPWSWTLPAGHWGQVKGMLCNSLLGTWSLAADPMLGS